MANQFKVQVLNQISQIGLKRLPAESYTVGKEAGEPDVILVRSADMHSMVIPPSVKAVGRAGAGTNNIPVKDLSARGIPVFNTPGANANAVKELVIAGLLLAARNIAGAINYVAGLDKGDEALEKKVEDGKKQFSGCELAGHTLGIIGLGKIGCLVADAAINLGMQVLGYDPEITVEAAWSLPSHVKKANSIDEILKNSHFVTLHVPLVEATKNLINAERLAGVRPGTVLLNFSREGVVNLEAVLGALEAKKLNYYVCDFPGKGIIGNPRVIALPHLGASTREAEDNCAVMVADQVRDYMEHGNILNAVNFPNMSMPRESRFRLAIANANVPNMVGQISTTMAQANLNIHNMMNKSKGEMAYTLVDVDSAVPKKVIEAMGKIKGVLAVRYLPLAG
ncbi:MAG TPA: phosphoglycerate dehydrogenase [Geobacteraceae bacterium]|nr:phosphoglycerate dehydrogenase [Geobacteraceae bacterium]